MILIHADSLLELEVNIPYWVDQRSALCNPRLEHFDAISGLLQFFTTCAASKNTWVQTLMFDGWNDIVYVVPPGYPFPEEDENAIRGDEPWETIRSRFPELINTNVRVHCNCPAFLWWGSWYNVDDRGSALYPGEAVAPNIRDPDRNNIVCKHLAAVLHRYF